MVVSAAVTLVVGVLLVILTCCEVAARGVDVVADDATLLVCVDMS